jgi:hypothetical protein
MVFLYFYSFLHCRRIVKTSKLWNNTWNHVVTRKCETNQNILYLTFFKVATLCLDDNFAHACHSLNQLHLESFSNRLEGVHTCWALVGCFSITLRSNSSQTISIGLRPGDWRPGHLMQHSITLLFCKNSPYTAWRCVGSLSCWKTL